MCSRPSRSAAAPDHAQALHCLGWLKHQEGAFDVVLELHQAAITIHNLARLYECSGPWAEAAEAYAQVGA